MIKDSKEHLNSVNETYVQHFKVATGIGLTMVIGGIHALLHAFCPGILRKSASEKIKDLNKRVFNRN